MSWFTISPLAGTTALALAALLGGCSIDDTRTVSAAPPDDAAVVQVAPGTLTYYPAGDYVRAGYPVSPAQARHTFERRVVMMRHQVSQADYALCVAEGACKPLAKEHRESLADNLPVVGVSWRDATDYATWYSARTGQRYRLPSYEEWVHAAGEAYKEDVILGALDSTNPAARWLAEYDLESRRKTSVDGVVKPFGSFGTNAAGLQDMVGNVWDWTDTCHVRVQLDARGEPVAGGGENCGIRVVAGPHRSYITDFIRDPKSGACSVGVPPSNLGIRLVRDETAPGTADTGRRSLRAALGLG
ncbi:MAG: formylglycine-generating enzyme family protein [Burkholderiaceae bacterium]|jgi:formylglycine-generating enzyme required for sulfatase activity